MLVHEKANQAQALLGETGLDCWLIFARETGVRPDPGVELVVGSDITWNSAFLFGRGGQRIAIVGRYDAPEIRAGGVFGEVIGYDEGISASLLAKLRARKTLAEVDRMRAAIAITEEIVALTGGQIRPGVSEAQLGGFIHDQFRARGLPSAWSWDACPIVNSGPESEPGHAAPRDDIMIEPGHLVHIDLGVKHEGYCSDIQRMWYVRRPGENGPPAAIQRAFATVVQAIEASAAALKPGVRGYEIDAIAREVVVDSGYEEYRHALGHGLGRACHDGGTLLGPRWERYGATPEGLVEAGNIFTLELGIQTEAGYVGLEEDVLVTEDGCMFLSPFQRQLMVI